MESSELGELTQIEELQRELQALLRKGAGLVAQMRPKMLRAVTGTIAYPGKPAKAERTMPTLLCGALPR